MQSLKKSLVSPPVLVLSDSTGHLTPDTDACDVQFGCVLLQEQPGNTAKRIEYRSRSLTNTEHQFDTIPRESLAIV